MNIEEAYLYCKKIASHYENFPVGLLVGKDLAPHVHAIYAFSRIADDYADEGYLLKGNEIENEQKRKERLDKLNRWQSHLLDTKCNHKNPVFLALHDTIQKFDLPIKLFTDLLDAFRQDVLKNRYENFEEVLDYCKKSANPIGRLVLYLHHQTAEFQFFCSDCICTALQLANFWQDISIDLGKNRIYLPRQEMEQFKVSEADLFKRNFNSNFKELLSFQVQRTSNLFEKGKALINTLPFPLKLEIALTWHGGKRILDKIEKVGYNTLKFRPKLHYTDFFLLLIKALRTISEKSQRDKTLYIKA
ncbi:squalene synthase HpnC [Methylacidiphilum caldifontis]|uniref:Squalene synthase HpnC n=1 Tax=Methylacidiphilum caldifontis TaxID=2795386 RepID=A0A4Y8PFE0_9BACT|nr:squalene synthase HpnC [Methylacidiphilum caldifontis]QSR88354.1 squalene synthase HpnC [Methylacidiphilum caldifontis]TFE70742.1 squalene synthase HpnC [Methylacidiphilum caldifontis]